MGKKILLADDSITIQKVIELTFSDEDFEVVTVGNGRLAIERVQEVRPDIVLCDIIMPEKDGYEVCDFVKKNPALSHIPVLLLTGAFEPFDQERAARVGCDGFLAKPFEPQTLIAKVKDLLQPGRGRAAQPATAAGRGRCRRPRRSADARARRLRGRPRPRARSASIETAEPLASRRASADRRRAAAPPAGSRRCRFIPRAEPVARAGGVAPAAAVEDVRGVPSRGLRRPRLEPDPIRPSTRRRRAATIADAASAAVPRRPSTTAAARRSRKTCCRSAPRRRHAGAPRGADAGPATVHLRAAAARPWARSRRSRCRWRRGAQAERRGRRRAEPRAASSRRSSRRSPRRRRPSAPESARLEPELEALRRARGRAGAAPRARARPSRRPPPAPLRRIRSVAGRAADAPPRRCRRAAAAPPAPRRPRPPTLAGGRCRSPSVTPRAREPRSRRPPPSRRRPRCPSVPSTWFADRAARRGADLGEGHPRDRVGGHPRSGRGPDQEGDRAPQGRAAADLARYGIHRRGRPRTHETTPRLCVLVFSR